MKDSSPDSDLTCSTRLALGRITMPSTVTTSLADYAFLNCQSITSVDLRSATSIGNDAFADCPSLTSVDLGSVTTIGTSAFADCPSLASVDLRSVTTIGSDAFRYCPALDSITYIRTSVASNNDDLVLVDSYGNVVNNGPATITRNDGGFLTL